MKPSSFFPPWCLALLMIACGGSSPSAFEGGGATSVGQRSSNNPMEPKAKGWSDEENGLIGSWIGVFEWGASGGDATTGGAESIKMTHRFSSNLRSEKHHYGIYRYGEEVSDIPRRGCRRVVDRSGTFDFDGKLLIVTLTEGKTTTRCPGAASTERPFDGESKQSYDAEVSGDLLALRSIVTGGVSVSPVVFKRDAP